MGILGHAGCLTPEVEAKAALMIPGFTPTKALNRRYRHLRRFCHPRVANLYCLVVTGRDFSSFGMTMMSIRGSLTVVGLVVAPALG